jgi:2-polyprenyl-3-methyl-5-hydroxy-6-metoxy-1,4-benzoquinol methylase
MTIEQGLEYVRCPLCRADNTELLFIGRDRNLKRPGHFPVVRCRQCGLIYTNPRPTIERLFAEFYTADYAPYQVILADAHGETSFFIRVKRYLKQTTLITHYGYVSRARSRPRFWEKALTWPLRNSFPDIPRFIPGGRLLEVGCASGYFLAMLRDLGWDVCGVEPNMCAAQRARDAGLDVRTGTLEQIAFPNCSFDVVIMMHVLEHVPDPLATLAEVMRILKPGGMLIVAVPNCASLSARLFGERWSGWDLPRHLTHFTPNSLQQMLDKVGLRVESMHDQRNPNIIFRSLRISRDESTSIIMRSLYNFLLTVAPAVLAIKILIFVLHMLGQSGGVVVVARKPHLT